MTDQMNPLADDIRHQLRKTPVAIIGIGSIFAQARNVTEYWENILNKIDAITDVPPSRWNVADYYDPDPAKPDKSYCKRGAFLPDIDFDPTEFGLPPNILEVTDVSQLLSLVVARDALEDAGYGEDHPALRETTGCILGVVGVSSKIYVPLTARLQYPVWERVLRKAGVSESDTQKIIEKFKLAYVGWEENSFPGSLTNVVAGRIANRFDLGGTNCVLDAACATSLAAIKMAIMELVEGRADMMLTGGVDTDNSIGVYMSFSKTPAFSKGEAVRTFDAESDGMMAGEGIGMVVLKRLADAEHDGDRIYAVIRGVGSSSDGRYKSIYAPRPGGQAIALNRAYAEAGYSPATVGLLEAHGTGTPAGDPAEFQGLREVFSAATEKRQFIAIGSVKSQIAHTKGAAGVAGLIKVSLALHHKILPATINVKKPNPKLNVGNSPFYINSETRPWFRHEADIPRRAGVSAFGFGGTNFHIAVEEYQAEHHQGYRRNSTPRMILLSAPNNTSLVAVAKETLTKIQNDREGTFLNELAAASVAQIPQNYARLGFVSASNKEAEDLLQTSVEFLQQRPNDDAWDHPKGIYYRKTGLEPKGKLVALFSGQGSQYLEMGRELACNFPPIRQAIGEMDRLFTADGLLPLSSRIFPPPVFTQEERDHLSDGLTQTEHAQPAIGSFSVGLYKLLQQAGFSPDFVAGHSFGELTALWASGVLSEKDYYFLAKSRGKAMAPPADSNFDTGTMLAVKGDVAKVRQELAAFPEITLANWNSDNQIVLAGSKSAVAKIQKHLADQGYSVIPLSVSAAFHTPLVEHAQKPFARAIHSVKFNPPCARVYANTTGKAHPADPKAISRSLEGHILNPVLFKDEIENIYAEGGYFFIEFGPKNVLTNLVKSILNDRPHLAVALNASPKKDSDRQFREAVVQLRVAGLNLANVDPYQAVAKDKPARKKSPVTVKLNGGGYVSAKTQAAFENALNDGWQITPTLQVKEVIVEKRVPVESVALPQSAPPPAAPVPAIIPTPELRASIGNSLTQLREHQSEVVRLHEQYLKNEEMYSSIYAKLSELEISLLSNSPQEKLDHILPALDGLERSMARFHEHQAETLRVHAVYLKSQEDFAANFIRLAEQQAGLRPPVTSTQTIAQPAPVRPGPIQAPTTVQAPAIVLPQPPAPPHAYSPTGNGFHASPPAVQVAKPAASLVVKPRGFSTEELTNELLNVVSEKTGYPVEMLEMASDMESDLGIDSIKRVEIMGAMRTRFPNLPPADPEAFAEVHTLGQTVEYMLSSAPSVPSAPIAAPVEPIVGLPIQPAQIAVAAPASGVYSADDLTHALLNVVSEKTGYPVEMLELDTDMESDLGIDSIKRVEILGAMRELYPNLPQADPEAFADVHTLDQTVQYMLAQPASSSGQAVQVAVDPQAVTPVRIESLTAAPVIQTAVTPSSAPALDVDALTASLLKVVSEKTGYPVEMLELDTDMESDLGIDSIKRVEILGALREEYPQLPPADPEAFAEVHTLGQIIAYLSQDSVQPVEFNGHLWEVEPADTTIPRGVVSLKLLPSPDQLVFALPENHICLLTHNGTLQTASVAQELAARNWKVVVLNFPPTVVIPAAGLPPEIAQVALEDMSEDHLGQCLDRIAQNYGPVGAFIHLNPPFPGAADGSLYSETEKQIIKQVFLLAKHLKDSLTSAARTGSALFMAVVELDGKFGLGADIDYSPISGGLFGLVKTLNLEWASVFCRAVDISPAIPLEQFSQLVVSEVFDPNRRIIEVGCSPEGRMTLGIEQSDAVKVIQ
jgi:acyl transferase domain-containing protein